MILFAGALQWAGADARLGRFVTDQESLGMRLAIWRICAGIVPHFPLFGSGMDTFGSLMIRYQTAGDLHYQEAHNDYLQLLTEGGVITFALVLAAIAAVVAGVMRRLRADHGVCLLQQQRVALRRAQLNVRGWTVVVVARVERVHDAQVQIHRRP